MEKLVTIYKLSFLGVNDNRVYIGKTQRKLADRRNSHIQLNKDFKVANIRLKDALLKYGKDALVIEAIEECSESDSVPRELYWINYYDSTNLDRGFNIVAKSQTINSYNLTEEQKNKISHALKGREKTLEHREKLRQVNMGKKQSEETKQKQREWYDKMGGWTEEQKKMMGQSASYARSDETKKRMSSGTEKKIAEMKGMTLEEWRKVKSDAIHDWKVNGMKPSDVSAKYKIDKSMLYDWYKKLQNT